MVAELISKGTSGRDDDDRHDSGVFGCLGENDNDLATVGTGVGEWVFGFCPLPIPDCRSGRERLGEGVRGWSISSITTHAGLMLMYPRLRQEKGDK